MEMPFCNILMEETLNENVLEVINSVVLIWPHLNNQTPLAGNFHLAESIKGESYFGK